MPTKLMMIFVGLDFVFAGCGGLLLGFSLTSEQRMRDTPTIDNVMQNLLLGQCPLTGMTNSDPGKGRTVETDSERWRVGILVRLWLPMYHKSGET